MHGQQQRDDRACSAPRPGMSASTSATRPRSDDERRDACARSPTARRLRSAIGVSTTSGEPERRQQQQILVVRPEHMLASSAPAARMTPIKPPSSDHTLPKSASPHAAPRRDHHHDAQEHDERRERQAECSRSATSARYRGQLLNALGRRRRGGRRSSATSGTSAPFAPTILHVANRVAQTHRNEERLPFA